MNILYLAHRIPYPPNKGDKIRAFNEIKFFSQNHTVDVACLIDTPNDKQYIEPLKKHCRHLAYATLNAKIKKAKSVFSALCSGTTCTEEFFHSKDLQKQIDEMIVRNNYDIIYIFCSSMASYVRDKHNIPRVIDFVDIDSDKWIQYSKFAPFFIRWLYRREGKMLGLEEENILSWAEAAFLVTELEAEFFSHLDQSSKVYGIPNGIDRSFFDPDKTPSDEQLAKEKYVCFTGAMDYFPNEDGVLFFYEKIYPYIRKQLPDLKLYVVGSNPTPRLQKLAQDKNVVVTGTVDDIRPYIKYAQLSVVPLRMARGIQNKILEAIAMGAAVVCTSNAAEGLVMRHGTDLYIEDDEQKFATRVIDLLNDPEKRMKLLKSAQQQLIDHYDWQNNLKKMESIMKDIVSGKKKNAEGGI